MNEKTQEPKHRFGIGDIVTLDNNKCIPEQIEMTICDLQYSKHQNKWFYLTQERTNGVNNIDKMDIESVDQNCVKVTSLGKEFKGDPEL